MCVEFSYLSPDGENGYPGSVLFKTFYTITKLPSKFEVQIKMTAELSDESEGKSCPINLTNHSYFNLGGHDN